MIGIRTTKSIWSKYQSSSTSLTLSIPIEPLTAIELCIGAAEDLFVYSSLSRALLVADTPATLKNAVTGMARAVFSFFRLQYFT